MSQYVRSRMLRNGVESPEASDQRQNSQNDGLKRSRESSDQGPELEKDDSKRRTTPKPSGINQKKPPDFPSPDRSTVNSGRFSESRRHSTLDSRHRRPFRFENLEVWQAARSLNRQIYRITRKFPSDEQYGLTSQLRRASVSVSSNIAEGSGRNSDRDFAHFLEQAYGSLMEIVSQLYLAKDENYIDSNDLEPVLSDVDKLARKTVALNRSMGVGSSKIKLNRVERREARANGENAGRNQS